MNLFNLLVGFLAILATSIGIYYRRQEKTTLQKLHNMVDSAISGTFEETSYDETRLSAIEGKLMRFLSLSKTSRLDISEEKDKIKALVSDISHQTKTPIANIILYAQLLYEQKDLPTEARQLTSEVIKHSEKLNFLVQALVKTSRLETGIISINARTSLVIELLQISIQDVRKKADEKSITINLTMDEEIRACFDPKWTEEAIVNILDNAIKYTPVGGNIALSVKAYDMFTCIEISDNGIGIKASEINLIFKRFYRSPLVNQYEGVGVGLYLAREIISGEGGYIKVKSELTKGTYFSVFLPNN